MKRSLTKRIIYIFIIIFSLVPIVALSGCKKKTTITKYDKQIHNYREVISTENISSVEYCLLHVSLQYSHIYKESNYTILNDEYKTKFINSINSDKYKFKYSGLDLDKSGGWKNFAYNTFIIHYNDGTKTILDCQYVSQFDVDGNKTYFEALNPYECEINCSMFLDFPKTTEDAANKDYIYMFVSDQAFYEMKRVSIDDPNLGEGEKYYRYFKLFNGCITCDYYDIKYKDDAITYFIFTSKFINGLDALPITQPGYEYDESDTTIKSVDKFIVYDRVRDTETNNRVLSPIEVNYINKEIAGVARREIICIDLRSGEKVPYPSFLIEE